MRRIIEVILFIIALVSFLYMIGVAGHIDYCVEYGLEAPAPRETLTETMKGLVPTVLATICLVKMHKNDKDRRH